MCWLQGLTQHFAPATSCLKETQVLPCHLHSYSAHYYDHRNGDRANGGTHVLVKECIFLATVNIQTPLQVNPALLNGSNLSLLAKSTYAIWYQYFLLNFLVSYFIYTPCLFFLAILMQKYSLDHQCLLMIEAEWFLIYVQGFALFF